MKMKKGYKALVDEATAKIRTLTTEEARKRHGDANVVFVDLRDVRELEREGMIPAPFMPRAACSNSGWILKALITRTSSRRAVSSYSTANPAGALRSPLPRSRRWV